MAKALKPSLPNALVRYGSQPPAVDAEISISPLTGLLLRTPWGAQRFTRLVDLHTGLNNSLSAFAYSQARLANIQTEISQVLSIEQKQREDVFVALQNKMYAEGEILKDETARRKEELARDIARLKAEQWEFAKIAQPPAPPAPQPRRNSAEDDMQQAIAGARLYFALTRELRKMHREVDESVAAGEFTEREGEEIKGDMEDKIYAGLHKKNGGKS